MDEGYEKGLRSIASNASLLDNIEENPIESQFSEGPITDGLEAVLACLGETGAKRIHKRQQIYPKDSQ